MNNESITELGLALRTVAEHPLVSRAEYSDGSICLKMLEVDSREIVGGGGFFALSGLCDDGHQFAESALARGARAIFFSNEDYYQRWLPRVGKKQGELAGVFFIPHPRRALAALGAELFKNPSEQLNLLGVVGTNGKTSVVQFLSQLLTALKIPCGVAGTLGTQTPSGDTSSDSKSQLRYQPLFSPYLTTPENPHMQAFLANLLQEKVSYAAMEVSSIGWTQHRCDGLNFAALAFTNLGRDHLDWHGNLEAYQVAKFSPFLATDAKAVVNISDTAGQQLMLKLEQKNHPVLSFGNARAALFVAELVQTPANQQTGLLCFEGQREPFCFPLAGRFQLDNFLASVGLLLVMGHPLNKIAQAAQHCRGIPGRMQQVAHGQPFEVLVDYAHTPDALATLIRDTRPLLKAGGQLRLLFGCGGNRDKDKRPLMGAVASQADDIVLTSDNPRFEDPVSIMSQVAEGLTAKHAEQIVDRKTAIFSILSRARSGDVVLIAGRGHEAYQVIKNEAQPFSDALVAQEFFANPQKNPLKIL